jgi:hypothetical protein
MRKFALLSRHHGHNVGVWPVVCREDVHLCQEVDSPLSQPPLAALTAFAGLGFPGVYG